MGSIIGHRIDYNGVGALRGQQHTPSKNLTHEFPPPPNPALPLGNRNPQMIYFSCFRIAPVILCTVTVKAREQSKLSNYSLSWELPWTDSESLKTWWLHSEWSGTSKGLMRWLVRQLLQRFYSYSFFHHAPHLLGSRTVVQLSCDWSEVHRHVQALLPWQQGRRRSFNSRRLC